MVKSHEFEQEKVMPYVTTIERLGREEGLKQGREEGLKQGLQLGRQEALREDILEIVKARFGEVPYELRETIQRLESEAELKKLLRQAAVVPSIGALRSNG
jgi:flagellar biosynthesis/type III secretory pathway protein FliH